MSAHRYTETINHTGVPKKIQFVFKMVENYKVIIHNDKNVEHLQQYSIIIVKDMPPNK